MNENKKSVFATVLTIVIAVILGAALIFGFIYWDKNNNSNSSSDDAKKSSGADSDGVIEVPSEISKIQDAVDAAKAGDTVKIAEGTYSESTTSNGIISTVRIDKALTIEGAGRGKTILDGKDRVSYGVFIADGIEGKVVVKDLTIQNYEMNGVNGLSKLVDVSGLTISGSGNQGAYFKSATHESAFHNNIVVESQFDGVRGERTGIQIYNNTIVGNGTAGISYVLTDTDVKATSPEMFNNIIADNGTYGILYDYPPYPKDAVVDHNNVFGNTTAAYFQFKNNERTKSSKVTPTPGTGELATNPSFVDTTEYMLPEGSKLLTASRSGGELGAYGK